MQAIMATGSNHVVFEILYSRENRVLTSLETWLVFKEKVLSDRSMRESTKDIAVACACSSYRPNGNLPIEEDVKRFRSYIDYFWDITLCFSLPFRVEADDSHGGLKIVGRRNVKVEYLIIMGFFFVVSESEYALLVEAKYFSLFKSYKKKLGILFGPLSLMNHKCKHIMFLPDPCRSVRGKAMLEDDIYLITKLKCEDDEMGLNADKEWLVNYFPSGTKPAWFSCICDSCRDV